MVAHLCASFGWTVEYVESTLDGPRLQQLTRYLASNPPVHLLVKWFVGYEAPALASAKPQSEEERLTSFIDAFRAATGDIH